MNRPQASDLTGKRPPPRALEGPVLKHQRQFHVTTGETEYGIEQPEYEPAYSAESSEQAYYTSLEREGIYELPQTYESEEENDTELVDAADINFLG